MIIPWTRIGSEGEARAWSETLERSPRQSMSWTSISGALAFSRGVLAESPFEAARRVIDVSGDGANTIGRPVGIARDEAVAAGVTINGLPDLTGEPDLEAHDRDAVIGGPGTFMIAIDSYDQFAPAILRKLASEIAGNGLPRQVGAR